MCRTDIARWLTCCVLSLLGQFVGVVNVPYMATSTQVHIKPFMALAEQLGSVVAQLSTSPIKTVELRTWGGRDVNIASKNARLLLEAKVLQGIEKYSDLGKCPITREIVV